MNKLTKLLSVFIIAGAVGASFAGVSGCKKGNGGNNEGGGHDHNYTWVDDGNGECHEHCNGEGECDAPDKTPQGHVNTNPKDDKCDRCGATLEEEKPDPPKPVVAAKRMTIGGAAAVRVGGTATLTAALYPAGVTGTVTWSVEGAAATIDAATGVLTGVSEGQVTVTATLTGTEITATKQYNVVQDSATVKYITTVEEFNAFRSGTTESGKTYKLAGDLDLAGVSLGVASVEIVNGATFDGDGFTISNAAIQSEDSKIAILAKLVSGGTVTNVKFLSCSISTSAESAAIIAGECNTGDPTFSKIEFNSCSVTCGNYGGLVFARNESNGITANISEITTKNGCTLDCTEYGGLLVGDSIAGTTLNFNNLHIEGTVNRSKGSVGFIAGRSRGGAVSVQNSVISANVVSSGTNNGIIVGGSGTPSSLTVTNVLIIKSKVGKLTNNGTATATNVATVAGVTVTGATANDGQNTVEYLTETLGFDFENVWTAEGEGGYRLKAASTNVKSADAAIVDISVSSANAKTRFKVGETFSADGLVVMGVYSDGVQLVLNGETGYEVVSTAVNMNNADTYTVTVKSKEDETIVATYEVVVAAETGFKVYDEFMAHTYLTGEKLDTGNLVVKSTWTDGIEEILASDKYTLNADSYDMAVVGTHNVQIKYGDYDAKTIKIDVSATKPVPVDGKIYINVDAGYTGVNGAQVQGVETFNSVASAIDYLEACKLDNSVQKVIYVGEGTYEAKITTDLANLVLIGKGTDKSILTYSAVESTVDPVTGKAYGLACATLHVNGEGFKAYKIAIRNDFNYIRDNKKESSPQGLALTINGDKAVLENCLLYGNQDTLYLKKGRTYLKNTTIEGNVDFIFGECNGLAYFDNCTINAISRFDESTSNKSNNGYVTAMRADNSKADQKAPTYGYIFDTCNFTHGAGVEAGSMSLGRPWGADATVAMISCSFSAAYSTHGYQTDVKDPAKPNEFYKGRWEEMSGNKPQNAEFVEYGSTGEGAITTAVVGGAILDNATNYTAANMFAATNGNVTWASGAWAYTDDVTLLATLAGEKVATATGIYVSSESVSVEAGKTANIQISVNPWNAADKTITGLTVTSANTSVATYADGVITGVAAGTTTITVHIDGLTDKVINVEVTAPDTSIKAHTYTFTYSEIDKATLTAPDAAKPTEKDKAVIAQSDLNTASNSFLTLVNESAKLVTWRSSNSCIENKDDGLSVTFQGTGTITITFASTGGNNNSRLGLKDSSGNYVAGVASAADSGAEFKTVDSGDEAGTIECGYNKSGNGTKKVTVTFTVTAAGTYKISCPSATTTRGARIMGIVMVDNFSDAS